MVFWYDCVGGDEVAACVQRWVVQAWGQTPNTYVGQRFRESLNCDSSDQVYIIV